MKIFVSIVSYRDPLLRLTLESLIENKSRRHEATYSILEQTALEESLEALHPELVSRPDVVYKRIDPIYSDGVGWARAVNAMNLRDEDLYYQIDSHMLFDPNWDRMLVEDYKLGVEQADTDRVIITGSCKVFGLDEHGEVCYKTPERWTSSVKYFTYHKNNDIMGAHGDVRPPSEDITPAIHICAGNFFTHAAWVKNVGINHKIFFDGEEQLMTLESFEAGYCMFHHREIGCYHFNGSGDYVTKQWHKPLITMEEYGRRVWRSQQQLAEYLKRVPEYVLEAYREYSGVDYINQTVEDRGIAKQAPKAPPEISLLNNETSERTDDGPADK